MESSRSKSGKQILALHKDNPKGNIKKTMIRTVAEAGVSVIGGGLIGSALGKPSFLIGLAVAGIGFYKDIYWLAPIGLGMMSTSVFLPPKTESVSGFDLKSETANAKERLLSFKDGILHKTYLDKIIPSKTTTAKTKSDESTDGFGDIEASLNALDEVEKQINTSANNFYNRRGHRAMSNFSTPMSGKSDEPDFSGM